MAGDIYGTRADASSNPKLHDDDEDGIDSRRNLNHYFLMVRKAKTEYDERFDRLIY